MLQANHAALAENVKMRRSAEEEAAPAEEWVPIEPDALIRKVEEMYADDSDEAAQRVQELMKQAMHSEQAPTLLVKVNTHSHNNLPTQCNSYGLMILRQVSSFLVWEVNVAVYSDLVCCRCSNS